MAKSLLKSGNVRASFLASAIGLSRSSIYYRPRRKIVDNIDRRKPANALNEHEKQAVLKCVSSPEFWDETPYEIVPKLMDRGEWLCSISTMYRILKENKAIRERRSMRRHPQYKKPVLEATRPNQVWTWDITRIPGPFKGHYYYLYVMIDLFSRYVVGWSVNIAENSEFAQHFIRESIRKADVNPLDLTIHSDRGAPMTASGTVELLATLGLAQSFSRPRTSNDNAYSESQFKTLKYHRLFKGWYESIEDAKQSLDKFFIWYNNDHMHGGLGLMTPSTVYYNKVDEVSKQRHQTLQKAFEKHPERFSGKLKVQLPPSKVGINLPKEAQPAIKYLQS